MGRAKNKRAPPTLIRPNKLKPEAALPWGGKIKRLQRFQISPRNTTGPENREREEGFFACGFA